MKFVRRTFLYNSYKRTTFNYRSIRGKSYINLKKGNDERIMAHVDAGKTTLSESILYLANEIPRMGNIDDGTTQLDYMPLEQERGITIRSACFTFKWHDSTINIIDTPGHSDFTQDVYRAMEVIDGCILVIDGSRNVEAQTFQIYSRLPKNIPLLLFINKLDREGVTLESSIKNITDRLKCNPLPMVDIIDGNVVNLLDEDVKTNKLKDSLKNKLIDLDDEISDLYITNANLDKRSILSAIKRQMVAGKVIPLFAGSALKKRGVSTLLDYISNLIPNPIESNLENPCNLFVSDDKSLDVATSVVCYIFKILVDSSRRLNCFIRVCYGVLNDNDMVKNSATNSSSKISGLFKVKGSKYIGVKSLVMGDIGVIYSNGVDFRAGQYLFKGVDLNSLVKNDRFFSCGLSTTQLSSVCFATLEAPKGVSDQELLKCARLLSIEDPSIVIQYNTNENDNISIGALGELQLEIFLERLSREYGINAKLGPVQISFKERVIENLSHEYLYDDISIVVSLHTIDLPDLSCFRQTSLQSVYKKFSLSPSWNLDYQSEIRITLADTKSKQGANEVLDKKVIDELLETARFTIANGPINGGEVISTKFEILLVNSNHPLPVLKRYLSKTLKQALTNARIEVYEPLMRIDVDTRIEYMTSITNYLTSKAEAEIWQVLHNVLDSELVSIVAAAKLSKLNGISGKLKSLGRGHTNCVLLPIGYIETRLD